MKAKVEGVDNLVAKLEDLAKKVKNKILRKATTKGCQPVNKTAKQNAPQETGLLKKSLGYKVKTYPDTVVGVIGPRLGFGQTVTVNGKDVYRDPAKYAFLVEHGTQHSQANPFMRRSWEECKKTVQNVMRDEIQAGIEKEVK